MSATIRPANRKDIDAIYAISCAVHLGSLYKQLIAPERYDDFVKRFTPDRDYFSSVYSLRILKRLSDPNWFYWVSEVDGAVRGFTLAHQTDTALELKGLFVDEAYQGQGLGKKLFEMSCSIARPGQSIALEVIAKNGHAIGIYSRMGFERVQYAPKPFFGTAMIRMEKC